MIARDIYLVRHGSYEYGFGNLNDKGMEQSRGAMRELVFRGIGSSALILCSSAPRAIHTSEIIAEGTGCRVVPSDALQYAALDPRGVADLDRCIEKSLLKAGETPTEELIVVAHEPLLQTAAYGTTKNVPHFDNGEIFKYEPGTWQNQDLDLLETAIVEALLS